MRRLSLHRGAGRQEPLDTKTIKPKLVRLDLLRNYVRLAIRPFEQRLGLVVIDDMFGLRVHGDFFTAHPIADVAVVDHQTGKMALGDIGVGQFSGTDAAARRISRTENFSFSFFGEWRDRSIAGSKPMTS